MRSTPVFLAAAIALAVGCMPAEAAALGTAAAALKTEIAASRSIEPVCRGCGCRGGPGYRQPNGKCASWGRR
mgnify:CR=1 FL=1